MSRLLARHGTPRDKDLQMSPEEIWDHLAQSCPELQSAEREEPHRFSFFLGTPIRGSKANRILRVTSSSAGTRLKLAVSSRLQSYDVVLRFSGDANALADIARNEIRLYRMHFENRKR
jgi:hypothetical protein